MIDPVTMNARKPREDEYGYAMLNRMNEHHKLLHKWALEHISIDSAKQILDIGFGGGDNIKNMCRLAPDAKIYGIDYSEASYKKCTELNSQAIKNGTVELQVGSADALPYEKNSFDLITAFETVYYWPNIEACFHSIYGLLRDKGAFLICNEDCTREGNEEIAQTLDMNFYDLDDLKKLLLNAGFEAVHTYRHKKGNWICVVGIRQNSDSQESL